MLPSVVLVYFLVVPINGGGIGAEFPSLVADLGMLAAGLAGFLFLSRFGTITVAAGQGLELASVAAAVVGGVSILGGSGTLIGALLGALLIDLLELSLVRVPEVSVFWRDAVLGALILLAISTDFAIGRRLRRLWTSPARRSPEAPEREARTDA